MPDRHAALRRAIGLSVASIAWSGVVGGLAIVSAVSSGSLALLGFGVDAVVDATASAALVWRFRVEAREPARAERVERAAERVVGLALIVLAAYLVFGAVRALASQAHPEASALSLGLLVASLLILPPLAIAKARVAMRLGSGALRADSILTGVAAILAAITLASLAAASAFGWWWADAIGALVVAVIVVREGWGSLTLSRSSRRSARDAS